MARIGGGVAVAAIVLVVFSNLRDGRVSRYDDQRRQSEQWNGGGLQARNSTEEAQENSLLVAQTREYSVPQIDSAPLERAKPVNPNETLQNRIWRIRRI